MFEALESKQVTRPWGGGDNRSYLECFRASGKLRLTGCCCSVKRAKAAKDHMRQELASRTSPAPGQPGTEEELLERKSVPADGLAGDSS